MSKPVSENVMSAFAVKAPPSATIDTVSGDDIIGKKEIVDHLNATVFKPELGAQLKHRKASSIVDGISEQILLLLIRGASVKFGRLGTFSVQIAPPGKRKNPRTQQTLDYETKRIRFDAARRIKEMLNESKHE